MVKSMTGFACTEQTLETTLKKNEQISSASGKLTVILKSLNSRYLDLILKIPEEFKSVEPSIRNLISDQVVRGKVECIIRYTNEQEAILSIDYNFLSQLIEQSKALAKQYELPTVRVDELIKIPGVINTEKTFDLSSIQSDVLSVVNQTIQTLNEQRQQEGDYLSGLLQQRLEKITLIVEQIKSDYQKSSTKLIDKLNDKLQTVAEKYQQTVDDYRFEQEVAILLQKTDLTEEIDRLLGHVEKAQSMLITANQPIGRKFDFLIQEMNRESNTIASKSQFLGVTYNAVELKVLLEQMREQVQNIE